MKKQPTLLSLFLCLSMVFCLCTPSALASGTYSDTNGHWAQASIDRWSSYGIVGGSNGAFSPDAPLTRGQMAKVLAEALGLTEQAANPFSDISEDAWYAPYVLRCNAAGIMLGSGGKAHPNAPITREEAMVMLCRGLNISPVSSIDFSAYTDGNTVSLWAAPYVAAMMQSGIVQGVGGEQLLPSGNISRASMMAMLDRTVVQYIDTPGTYQLTDESGVILIASGDVTLSGSTNANLLISPAAGGKSLTFNQAAISGDITVQADNVKITNDRSTLPDFNFTGTGCTVEQAPSSGGSTGGGNAGGEPPHAHTWDDGIVTLEPTATDEGQKQLTCTACGATTTEAIPPVGDKTMWISKRADGLYLNWLPFETDIYTCTFTDKGAPVICITRRTDMSINDLIHATDGDMFTYTVKDANGEEYLYSLTIEVSVEVEGEMPDFTVEGQANGKYKIITQDGLSAFTCSVNRPDGKAMGGSAVTFDANFRSTLYEGCTITAQTLEVTVSDDCTSLSVRRSSPRTVDSFTPCPPMEPLSVHTNEELQAALTRGGPIVLADDIGPVWVYLTTGVPAVLDLNGHRLDVGIIMIQTGKEVTIVGHTEGSMLYSSTGNGCIDVRSHSRLVLDGGQCLIPVINEFVVPARSIEIRSGTYSFDPSNYVDQEVYTITYNDNDTYTVSAKEPLN